MKKEYIKPQFDVVKIATHNILMYSGAKRGVKGLDGIEGSDGYGGTDTDGEGD